MAMVAGLRSRARTDFTGIFMEWKAYGILWKVALNWGLNILTLYAFSTENWDRPEYEVIGLMELLVSTIRKEVESLHKNNIKLHVIGDMTMLPEYARQELNEALDITKENTGLNLIMALSYSGRWELLNAVKNIAFEVKQGRLNVEAIDQDTLQRFLCTSEFPDPELMIRTSGEFRISNFLLYQLAYAELYFTNVAGLISGKKICMKLFWITRDGKEDLEKQGSSWPMDRMENNSSRYMIIGKEFK